MKKKKFSKELINLIDNSGLDEGYIQGILVLELLNSTGHKNPAKAMEKVLQMLVDIGPSIGVTLQLNHTKPTLH